MAPRTSQFSYTGTAAQAGPGDAAASLSSVNSQLRRIYQALAKLGGLAGEVRIPADVAIMGKLTLRVPDETPADSDTGETALFYDGSTVQVSQDKGDYAPFLPPEAVSVIAVTVANSTASGIWWTLKFDTEEFDDGNALGGMFVINQDTRITMATPGRYVVGMSVTVPPSAAGVRLSRIDQFHSDGTLVRTMFNGPLAGNAAFSTILNQSSVFVAKKDDYFTCGIFQDSGAPILLVQVANTYPQFYAVRQSGE